MILITRGSASLAESIPFCFVGPPDINNILTPSHKGPKGTSKYTTGSSDLGVAHEIRDG